MHVQVVPAGHAQPGMPTKGADASPCHMLGDDAAAWHRVDTEHRTFYGGQQLEHLGLAVAVGRRPGQAFVVTPADTLFGGLHATLSQQSCSLQAEIAVVGTCVGGRLDVGMHSPAA